MKKIKTHIPKLISGNRALNTISLITALFVARTAFPPLDRILIPLIIAVSIIIIIQFLVPGKEKLHLPKSSIAIYLPLILVFIFFTIAIIRSECSVLSYKNEMINLGIITTLIILHVLFIHDRKMLLRQRDNFFRVLFYLVTIISITGLIKFWSYLKGVEKETFLFVSELSLGSSLVPQADYFMTPIVAAMVGVILFKFRKKNPLLFSIIYHASFLTMFYTVIWSGSKKGLILMIIMFLLIILFRLIFIFHKSRVRNYNLIKNLNIIILTLGFSALFGTWVINFMPGEEKERWINKLGFDRYHFKSEMTLITFSHISTFNHKADLQKWYNRLWGEKPATVEALKDKITFTLIEQENLLLLPEPSALRQRAISTRKTNWEQSVETFKGFNIFQKVFGTGFYYLNHFKSYPLDDNCYPSTNYKNNYIVASLLYSGIFGFACMLFLLIRVFIIFTENRKELIALFTLFVVSSILFLLFHNTVLSNPLMLVAIIMPLRYKVV